MELLPLLYALLAAITGFSAGDRVAFNERAPVTACASSAVLEQHQAVKIAQVAVRPQAILAALPAVLPRWVLGRIESGSIFRVAGFAVRRQ